jgi:hypothetical protein
MGNQQPPKNFVIPAQAGIQSVKNSPQRETKPKGIFG